MHVLFATRCRACCLLGRYCVECLHTEANVAHLYCTLADFEDRAAVSTRSAVLEVTLRSRLEDVFVVDEGNR